MTERLDNATNYLIDLLRAYGHRPITVKITQEGEEVDVMARTFVKRQLAKAGILFPHAEGGKPNTRKVNTSLDKDMLSVIFHEALFEFEVAYVKANCEGNPKAEHFMETVYNWIENKQQWLNCTFPLYTDDELIAFPETPVEAIKLDSTEVDAETLKTEIANLKAMGYEQIANLTEMKQLFWELAMRRVTMGKAFRAAVKAITIEETALKYFSNSYRAYNRTIQKNLEDTEVKQEAAKTRTDIKKREAEMNEHIHAVKKELNDKIQKLRTDGSGYKKVSKKLKALLDDPKSDIQKTYDLTKEEDIDNFLSWYRLMKRVVRVGTVKSIERFRYPEAGALDLFKQKVEAHNAEFRQMEENTEEECTE